MEEYGESKEKDYPRGRGYGNDYMRGGEVFGGYGYMERADYDRPRGEGRTEQETDRDSGGDDRAEHRYAPRDAPDGAEADGDGAVERFPQDERAGGWDVPHDFDQDADIPTSTATASPGPTPRNTGPSPDNSAPPSRADAPEPLIEGTFGDTGGNLTHSRSYYVTQAQLQQRLYERTKQI